jgi:asparagine synthase (glutamine-hydrolysing)
LEIVDPEHGHQPQFDNDKYFCTVTNGEIYNYLELFKNLKGNYEYKGKSDCQVISYMFRELDIKEIANSLSGKFGFVSYDTKKDKFYVVRDHIGIIPVYLGRGFNGEIYICNELKAFHDVASTIEILLPGRIYNFMCRSLLRLRTKTTNQMV